MDSGKGRAGRGLASLPGIGSGTLGTPPQQEVTPPPVCKTERITPKIFSKALLAEISQSSTSSASHTCGSAVAGLPWAWSDLKDLRAPVPPLGTRPQGYS